MSLRFTTSQSIRRSTIPSSSPVPKTLSSPLDHKRYQMDDDDISIGSGSSNTSSPPPELGRERSSTPQSPTLISTTIRGEDDIDSAIDIPITPKRAALTPNQYKITKLSPSYLQYDDTMNLNRNWRARMKHAGHKSPEAYREALLKTLRKYWAAGYESSEEWKKANLLDGE